MENLKNRYSVGLNEIENFIDNFNKRERFIKKKIKIVKR